jgi:hypothetical protein
MLKKKKCATKKAGWAIEYPGRWGTDRDRKDKLIVGDAKMKLVKKLNHAKSPKGVELAAKQYHSVINKAFKGRKKPYYTTYYTEFTNGRGSKPI